MTDNETIKALECCGNTFGANCKECPLSNTDICQDKMIQNALNLINRQKAKIEALQMDNQQLQSDITNANMNADHALAEIERLQYCNETNISSLATLHERIKTAKAEAVKEFAERLKHKLSQYQREYRNVLNNDGACAMIIAKKGIDAVLKEMGVEV